MTKGDKEKIMSLIHSDNDTNQAIGLVQWHQQGMNPLCFTYRFKEYFWSYVSTGRTSNIIIESKSLAGYKLTLRRYYKYNSVTGLMSYEDDPMFFLAIQKGKSVVFRGDHYSSKDPALDLINKYAIKLIELILKEFDINI